MRASVAAPSICVAVLLLVFSVTAGPTRAQSTPSRSSAGSSASLKCLVSESEVMISGLTPGASIVLFSVSLEPRAYVSRIVRRSEVLTDDDRDQLITVRLSGKRSIGAVWAVVEVNSGRYAIASPANESPREMYEATRLSGRTKLDTDRLRFERAAVDVLLVRPGRGAWTLRSGDGWASDDDRTSNGVLTVKFDHFVPLTAELKGTTPSRVNQGDVIIAIDPHEVEYAVLHGAVR